MPRYTASEFERVLAFVRKQRAQWAEDVTLGKPKTFDEYRHFVGYIKAMDDIESEMAKITGTSEDVGSGDL